MNPKNGLSNKKFTYDLEHNNEVLTKVCESLHDGGPVVGHRLHRGQVPGLEVDSVPLKYYGYKTA